MSEWICSAVLEEQRRWFEAAQLRVLAAMQERDTSQLGLAQESVSLALQVPLRTAQGKLAQARTLVAELPRTLAAVAGGSISAEHARVLAEAVWRLPDESDAGGAHSSRRCCRRCSTAAASRCRSSGSGSAAPAMAAGPDDRRAAPSARPGRSDGAATSPARTAWPACRVVLGAPEAQLIYTRLTAAATLLPRR